MSNVAIVILNWNGLAFLKKFLPSVVDFSGEAQVVVVDNASTDTSLSFLSENFPKIQLVILDANYGFAEGYNRGLKKVTADYYILLNSDVEVTENWWQPLAELLDSDAKIAAVQPKICAFATKSKFEYAGACGGYLDKYGYPFCRGRILDTLEDDNGQYDSLQQVFWASGAAMAVKAAVFHEMGGFDTAFFAHMEEIDLCWRMQNSGYTIFCNPQSVVYHVGGGTLPNESPFKLYLNFRNNLWMLYKNLSSKDVFLTLSIRLCLDGVAAMSYLFSGNFKAVKSIWKAHGAFYRALPRLRKQRRSLEKQRKVQTRRYASSILWQYFVKNRHKFSKLPVHWQ